MEIGVPRETDRHEHRVGLTPLAVSRLTERGFTVWVERNAGLEARFQDGDYEAAGATIVYDTEEVYRRADVVCKVNSVLKEDLDLLKRGSTICGFHHLAIYPKEKVERVMELELTLIGYEIIRDAAGEFPVLVTFSEMAGQMQVPIAANCLQTEVGGRGILMGNVPGVPPPTVLILGAGNVGTLAARDALLAGAHVVVLDDDMENLRAINREFSGRVVTAVSDTERLSRYTAIADVVIGAILKPGSLTPRIITEDMVRNMRGGSVIIDVSIDQGGCAETSRPTTLDQPTFVVHDVVHYCVPNITSNIARTASRALADSCVPYLMQLGSKGLEAALASDAGLGAGVYIYQGSFVNVRTAEVFGLPVFPLAKLMETGDVS